MCKPTYCNSNVLLFFTTGCKEYKNKILYITFTKSCSAMKIYLQPALNDDEAMSHKSDVISFFVKLNYSPTQRCFELFIFSVRRESIMTKLAYIFFCFFFCQVQIKTDGDRHYRSIIISYKTLTLGRLLLVCYDVMKNVCHDRKVISSSTSSTTNTNDFVG